MRQQRTRRTSTPAEEVPASGYALIVDGQVKTEFETHDRAVKAAKNLKERFPMLQVKVYDAEKKMSENIALAAA
jgi:hypothetical protein